jgi:quercetin dioxygenase-like cupin family protein/type 1 glutamine amidotransferase
MQIHWKRWFLILVLVILFVIPVCGEDRSTNIVLIGGAKSHSTGEHDFPNGIRLLKSLLESSPDIRALHISIEAYPDGWPDDDTVLTNASTVVWYFDGLDDHPLLDAKRRTQFDRLMRDGVGLVTLHQSSTLPPDDKRVDLLRWLGGARYGMVDRTTEMVYFSPANHAISHGVQPFTYRDEFYPTVRYYSDPKKITPILVGKLHIQFENGKPIVIDRPTLRTVAWAFDRPGGGRSFGFTGLHYLVGLDQPELRKLLLNAIVWTAGLEVPKEGVRSGMPDAAATILSSSSRSVQQTVTEAIVTRPADDRVIEYPWGQLIWYTSSELKNSNTMTVGQAVIKPGRENPRHYHPNCDEVLHVLRGHILNSIGDKTVEMRSGDTISIPMGLKHNAKNIGTEDAVLEISFSSADRQTIGEDSNRQ